MEKKEVRMKKLMLAVALLFSAVGSVQAVSKASTSCKSINAGQLFWDTKDALPHDKKGGCYAVCAKQKVNKKVSGWWQGPHSKNSLAKYTICQCCEVAKTIPVKTEQVFLTASDRDPATPSDRKGGCYAVCAKQKKYKFYKGNWSKNKSKKGSVCQCTNVKPK
ncbi:MAG: hypothetical protein ACJAZS_000044 [Alteromonas naphthalenivorans]